MFLSEKVLFPAIWACCSLRICSSCCFDILVFVTLPLLPALVGLLFGEVDFAAPTRLMFCRVSPSRKFIFFSENLGLFETLTMSVAGEAFRLPNYLSWTCCTCCLGFDCCAG